MMGKGQSSSCAGQSCPPSPVSRHTDRHRSRLPAHTDTDTEREGERERERERGREREREKRETRTHSDTHRQDKIIPLAPATPAVCSTLHFLLVPPSGAAKTVKIWPNYQVRGVAHLPVRTHLEPLLDLLDRRVRLGSLPRSAVCLVGAPSTGRHLSGILRLHARARLGNLVRCNHDASARRRRFSPFTPSHLLPPQRALKGSRPPNEVSL